MRWSLRQKAVAGVGHRHFELALRRKRIVAVGPLFLPLAVCQLNSNIAWNLFLIPCGLRSSNSCCYRLYLGSVIPSLAWVGAHADRPSDGGLDNARSGDRMAPPFRNFQFIRMAGRGRALEGRGCVHHPLLRGRVNCEGIARTSATTRSAPQIGQRSAVAVLTPNSKVIPAGKLAHEALRNSAPEAIAS